MLTGFLLRTAALLLLVPRLSALSLASRRRALGWMTSAATSAMMPLRVGAEAELPDRFNVEDFLKTGTVPNPMGVSGQAGKSRPETGVVLRDGSEVQRAGDGSVLAEILLSGGSSKVPVLASFVSPWPLATGTVFDVECRDPKTGDGVFLAVSGDTGGRSVAELTDAFFVDTLFGPTGRFSSYGTPTDVKVKRSTNNGQYRLVEWSFATLSQSTQTELPRRALVSATIPQGTSQAVLLVGSASAVRWRKGSDQMIADVIASFRAVPAPQTSLKVRAKERRGG